MKIIGFISVAAVQTFFPSINTAKQGLKGSCACLKKGVLEMNEGLMSSPVILPPEANH